MVPMPSPPRPPIGKPTTTAAAGIAAAILDIVALRQVVVTHLALLSPPLDFADGGAKSIKPSRMAPVTFRLIAALRRFILCKRATSALGGDHMVTQSLTRKFIFFVQA